MAITPTILKEHVETDLADGALQRLIDAAAADVEAIAGTLGEVTYLLNGLTGRQRLHLARPAISVIEVTEGRWVDELTLVDPAEYALVQAGYVVERLRTGWERWVQVRYAPVQDVARRDGVMIDLIKLALQYEGLSSQSAGDYTASHVDYMAERQKLLRRMLTGRRWVF
ncbi:MAG: hypothetical protein ACREM3_29885 [Candidatus Rokuibacteriota bacterium]